MRKGKDEKEDRDEVREEASENMRNSRDKEE